MRELTNKEEKSLYAWCLNQGVNLEYGKLSLCDLRNFQYSNVRNDRMYQVHCEDTKNQWSMIYDNAESAITKFIELKSRVKRVK